MKRIFRIAGAFVFLLAGVIYSTMPTGSAR